MLVEDDIESEVRLSWQSNEPLHAARHQQQHLSERRPNATQIKPGVSITALVPLNILAGDSITRPELQDSGFSAV